MNGLWIWRLLVDHYPYSHILLWLRRLREMAVAVAETAAVVVAATMVAAAADADLTANKRRRSITLRRFFYLSSFSKRFSRRLTIVFSAFMRAYFLSLPSSIVHGAISVEVSVIMRSTYFS